MEEVIAVISFAEFVTREGSPLYLQLVRYVQRGIAAGTIRPGDELPSRRALAALLGVNPNTIQKACAMLEEEGVIASHTGAKSVVLPLPFPPHKMVMGAKVRAGIFLGGKKPKG